jgi:hypothetical protein
VGASSPWPKNFYQFSKVKNGTWAIEDTKEKRNIWKEGNKINFAIG